MTAPIYTAAQREDGSWGVRRDDGEIQGAPLTEELANATVIGAIWATEYLLADPGSAVSADAATTSPSVAGSVAGHFRDFDKWLIERGAWLKFEREHGGDLEHFVTRERELDYIGRHFRAALSKATGQ